MELEWKPVACSRCGIFGHNCNPPVPRNSAARASASRPVDTVAAPQGPADDNRSTQVVASTPGSSTLFEVPIVLQKQTLEENPVSRVGKPVSVQSIPTVDSSHKQLVEAPIKNPPVPSSTKDVGRPGDGREMVLATTSTQATVDPNLADLGWN